jgi:hypothetical protein
MNPIVLEFKHAVALQNIQETYQDWQHVREIYTSKHIYNIFVRDGFFVLVDEYEKTITSDSEQLLIDELYRMILGE